LHSAKENTVKLSFSRELPAALPGTSDGREGARVGASEVRLYGLAGLTVAVTADLPMTDRTFKPKFSRFALSRPEGEIVHLHHHFGAPSLNGRRRGRLLYQRTPWAIYEDHGMIVYVPTPPEGSDGLLSAAVFTGDHRSGRIYNSGMSAQAFADAGLHSLTLFPTDQIILGRVLADHQACYVHSSAVIMNGVGLVFVGHSGAGKSTVVQLIGDAAQVLCDDRNIIRVSEQRVWVHGSWSHGEVAVVSPGSAPLGALLFLRQAKANRLLAADPRTVAAFLVPCVVRPLVTREWWRRVFEIVEMVVREVPCYVLEFDKSGQVVPLLQDLTRRRADASGVRLVCGREQTR
jgi:hypothetical protein